LPGDPEACPIARAINRLVKKSVGVQVIGDDGVEFTHKDKFYVRKLPKKALNFIYDFDTGEAVEPIEFNLNIPEALLK